MKLILSSFNLNGDQDAELAKLLGKEARDTKIAYIENAYDVYHDEASLIEGRDILTKKGYTFELVDLREYKEDNRGLRERLAANDMFLLTGGNPYYLRWLMKLSGADEMIRDLVKNHGKVYSGASAAAVVAGPTLRHFDELDDPNEAGQVIWDGLNLTDIVVVPHIDNADFGEGCRKSGELCKKDGYNTVWLTDVQALLINGDEQRVI